MSSVAIFFLFSYTTSSRGTASGVLGGIGEANSALPDLEDKGKIEREIEGMPLGRLWRGHEAIL